MILNVYEVAQLCEDLTLKIGNKAGQKLKKAWKGRVNCKQQKLLHTINLFKKDRVMTHMHDTSLNVTQSPEKAMS